MRERFRGIDKSRKRYDKLGRIKPNEEAKPLSPNSTDNYSNSSTSNNGRNPNTRTYLEKSRYNRERLERQTRKHKDVDKELATLKNQKAMLERNKDRLSSNLKHKLDETNKKISKLEKEQKHNIVSRKNKSQETIDELQKKAKTKPLTKKEDKLLKRELRNQRTFKRQIKLSKLKTTGMKITNAPYLPGQAVTKVADATSEAIGKASRKGVDLYKQTPVHKGYDKFVKQPIAKTSNKTSLKISKTKDKFKNKIKKSSIYKQSKAKYNRSVNRVFGKARTNVVKFQNKMVKKGASNPRAIGRGISKIGQIIGKAIAAFIEYSLAIFAIVAVIAIILGIWFVVTTAVNFFADSNLMFAKEKIVGVNNKVKEVIKDDERDIVYNADEVTALLLTLQKDPWLFEDDEVKDDDNLRTKNQMIQKGYKRFSEEQIRMVMDLFVWEDDAHFDEYDLYKYRTYGNWTPPFKEKEDLIEYMKDHDMAIDYEDEDNIFKHEEEAIVKKGEKNELVCNTLSFSNDFTTPIISKPTLNKKAISFSVSDIESGIKSIKITSSSNGIFGFDKGTLNLGSFTFKQYDADYGPNTTFWGNTYEVAQINPTFTITVIDNAGNKTIGTAKVNTFKKTISFDTESFKGTGSYADITANACKKNPPAAKEDIKEKVWRGRTKEKDEFTREKRTETDKMKLIETIHKKEYKAPTGNEVMQRILYEYEASYNGVKKTYSPLNPYDNKGDCEPLHDSDNIDGYTSGLFGTHHQDFYTACTGKIGHVYNNDREFLLPDYYGGSPCSSWGGNGHVVNPSPGSPNYGTTSTITDPTCKTILSELNESKKVFGDYWVKYAALAEKYSYTAFKNKVGSFVYPKDYGSIYWGEKFKTQQESEYDTYLSLVELATDKSIGIDGKDNVITGDGTYIAPMKSYTVTSETDDRELGTGESFHYGLDIDGGYGADVYSPSNAKVYRVNNTCPPNGGYLGNWCSTEAMPGAGNFIQLEVEDKGHKIYITLMHLSEVDVQVGDTVKKGEYIGAEGHSGNSTGAHLHIEIHQDTPSVSTPQGLLKARDLMNIK